jgi:hypothetical protein
LQASDVSEMPQFLDKNKEKAFKTFDERRQTENLN